MAKTVAYYLSKGFDQAAAEYYAAGRRRIVSVEPNDDFTLTIGFDNGERRVLDMSWDIDPSVDSEKVWSNKVDLCPDSCYIDSIPVRGVANV